MPRRAGSHLCPEPQCLGWGEIEAASAGGKGRAVWGLHRCASTRDELKDSDSSCHHHCCQPSSGPGQHLPGPVPKQVLEHGGVTTTLPSTCPPSQLPCATGGRLTSSHDGETTQTRNPSAAWHRVVLRGPRKGIKLQSVAGGWGGGGWHRARSGQGAALPLRAVLRRFPVGPG